MNVEKIPSTNLTSQDVQHAFEQQSTHQWQVRRTTAAQRIDKLKKLKRSIESHRQDILDALRADLRKSGDGDLKAVFTEINTAISEIETWMKPVSVSTSEMFSGSEAKVIYEARGIVLLFGPWNYPFNLVFQPLVQIISAGNCAIVKPNEMAPTISAVSAKIIREVFDPNEVVVFEGGIELANKLLELPIDHIFFTGSPAVGKIIMAAAAKHLASVTLELGGKNPVIIDRDSNIQEVGAKLASFRTINNGQVCLCPENIWVHESQKDALIDAITTTYEATCYENGELNIEAMGKFIDQRNMQRVKHYVDDAIAKGAKLICGGEIVEETLSMHPTLLTEVPSDARILEEEVFGPILTIFTYKEASEIYAALHKQPKPLAVYIFSHNDEFIEDVLANTSSGGVTVNNCMMHCVEENLPFGGVNQSGIGSYHGVHGFKELSHARSVLKMP